MVTACRDNLVPQSHVRMGADALQQEAMRQGSTWQGSKGKTLTEEEMSLIS